MKIEEIILDNRTPGSHIYHASRFLNLKESLLSIQKCGLWPAKNVIYSPGVYMSFTAKECVCRVTSKESRVLESRWQSLQALYGSDPTNPAGMPGNYKLQNISEGLKIIQKLGMSNLRSGLKDENFYQAAANETYIIRANWAKLEEMFGVYPTAANGIIINSNEIIVPDNIPASALEIEYKPAQWISIDSAIEKL